MVVGLTNPAKKKKSGVLSTSGLIQGVKKGPFGLERPAPKIKNLRGKVKVEKLKAK